MNDKWLNFLFVIVARFMAWAIIGAVASILICAPIGRHEGSHPLLVWVVGDEAHPHRLLYWLGAWSLVGALISVFTTAYWQTPWYKYERLRLKQDKPVDDTRLSSLRWTQRLGPREKTDEDDHTAV